MERRAALSLRGPASPAGSTVRTVRFAKARSWGRRAVRRVRCENRFVARYGFNLATVLHHRRHPRPLSDLAREVAETLRRDGVAAVDAVALLGGTELLDRVGARAED